MVYARMAHRVKVYRLIGDGRWEDKGTGYISVEYLERSDTVGLAVVDEIDNTILLVHRISTDDIYKRQDTIISWIDSEAGTEQALSFQEAVGCSFIWDQICSVQRCVQFTPIGAIENGSRPIIDELEQSGASQDDGDAFQDTGSREVSELPPMELAALPQIVKFIGKAGPMNRDRIAALIHREQTYIQKLLELFRVCEDLENIEGLHMIFKIVKGIISLNDGHIFDKLFSDDYIMDVVGALEYDPEFSSRQNHRGFLEKQVAFKEALPINDRGVLSKIHQTYRIGYIKDVILARSLDDQSLSAINSMMLFNNMAVVSSLHSDSKFISALFLTLKSSGSSESVKRELVLFIQELCNISKNLQPSLRNELFSSLVKEGLFEVLTTTLQSSDNHLSLSGCDILIVVSNHDPLLLRTFLIHQQGHILFSLLVKGMLTPTEGGLQAQLLEVMRMLLDLDTMDRQQPEKSSFLEVFYEKYMDQLVGAFTIACPSNGTLEVPKLQLQMLESQTGIKASTVSSEILGHLCELMCFCVRHHGFRIKYYILRNNLVEKVLQLTHRKEKYLIVAAVRFLRACVGVKDEFYNRYLIKNNLFDPVVQAFLSNGSRYNLLNSAVLELIDFIRKANVKSLIVHLVEKYSDRLGEINYIDTFQQLKLRYEQLLEGPADHSRDTTFVRTEMEHFPGRVQQCLDHASSLSALRMRNDERALDKQEEDYFNEDSDDEDTASVGKTSSTRISRAVIVNGSVLGDGFLRNGPFGLVDYEDDDDDVSTFCVDKRNGSLQIPPEGNSRLSVPLSDSAWPGRDGTSHSRRKPSGASDKKAEGSASLKRSRQELKDENLHGRRYTECGSMRNRENKHAVTENSSASKFVTGYKRSSQKAGDRKETRENKSSNNHQARKSTEDSILSETDGSCRNASREKRTGEKIPDTSVEKRDEENVGEDNPPQIVYARDEEILETQSNNSSDHKMCIRQNTEERINPIVQVSMGMDQSFIGPPLPP